MKRRTLIRGAAVAGALGATGLPAAAAAQNKSRPDVIKPRRLEPGMTVGLVAPASSTAEDEQIRFAADIVRSFGFTVKEGRHLFARRQYLAGTDAERAADLMAMFTDPDVDAIFCLRGGYGAARILPLLDYDAIRRHPKVLLGYSDITALLNAIFVQAGLIGFHGPVANQTFTEYTLAEFRKVLFEPSAPLEIGAAPPFEPGPGRAEKENRLTVFRGGRARGRLIGGNLSLLATLMGTPYEPDFAGNILVLEDVNEAPYRVDRMLTQMWLAGRLQQVAAIAFGKFTETATRGNTFSIEEVIEQRCLPLGVPVVRGVMVGHVEDQTVIPIGARAELDADAGRLRLLETAVL